jgi:diphthine-ammonia ligase
MKVCALVSGGKDSCYSMMKCIAHGHEVVALANLHPSAEVGEELDSFMYQTVGHAHISAIAEAMELPLFRREITGTAVEQGMSYGETSGDEVEDLMALLSQVLEKMPEVDAVCSGAILSNYQRSRVESVCERLGLASLAFLWQRDQAEILDEMVEAGVNAVLVKVASLGLGSAQLGRSIGELRPHFHKLAGRGFGFHVAGEGGEYETFTLDCPLFHYRLEPFGQRVIEHGGGASLLSFEGITLCKKSDAEMEAPGAPIADAALPEAAAADDDDDDAHTDQPAAIEAVSCWAVATSAAGGAGSPAEVGGTRDAPTGSFAVEIGGGLVHVAAFGGSSSSGAVVSSAAQLKDALSQVRTELERRTLSLSHVLLLRLYVADMAEYKEINRAFSAELKGCAPAARVAVQLPLAPCCGDGCRVAVECVAWSGPKRLLHVQSVSEWAPRMIGPYGQLTVGLGVGHLAGSLGLRPATMLLAEGGAVAQARLSLANCASVLRGFCLSEAGALALVVYIVNIEDAAAVREVATRWLRRVTDMDASSSSSALPPLLLLLVDALPMGALVETQLEVCEDGEGAGRLYREHWAISGAAGCEIRCDATVAGAVAPPPLPPPLGPGPGAAGDEPPPTPTPVACGLANCLVSAPNDSSALLELCQITDLLGAAAAQLVERLHASKPALEAGAALYARVFFDSALGLDARNLCAIVRGAVSSATSRPCVAFALPVTRVLAPAGGVRMAVQLHFTCSST